MTTQHPPVTYIINRNTQHQWSTVTCISQSHAHTNHTPQGEQNENMTAVLICSTWLMSFDGNSQNLFPNLAYVLECIPVWFWAFISSGKCPQLLNSWQNCVFWGKSGVCGTAQIRTEFSQTGKLFFGFSRFAARYPNQEINVQEPRAVTALCCLSGLEYSFTCLACCQRFCCSNFYLLSSFNSLPSPPSSPLQL